MKHHLCPICHVDWDECKHTDAEVADWRATHKRKNVENLADRLDELERRVKALEELRSPALNVSFRS